MKRTINEYDFCNPYFTEGEYVLWTGKPVGKDKNESGALVPFGIFLLAFSLIWTVAALFFGGWMVFLGIPFIFFGIYLLFGRAFIRNKSRYVITNKKIYRGRFGKVKIMEMSNLPRMRLARMNDGRGSIYFGEPDEYAEEKVIYGAIFDIECVENVNEVYRFITDSAKNY